MCWVLFPWAFVDDPLSLGHKAEIGDSQNTLWASRQWSYAHKLGQKQDGIWQAAVTYYYCLQLMMRVPMVANRSERCNMHRIHANRNTSNECQKYRCHWVETLCLQKGSLSKSNLIDIRTTLHPWNFIMVYEWVLWALGLRILHSP